MKTKLHLLGMSLLSCSYMLTAQTTHSIDWGMSTGAAATIIIEVGDAIEWTNIDAMSHNVVSTDPEAPAGFGSGTMAQNDTYLFTFNDPVIFTYVCSFHPGAMTGVIRVEEVVNCAPPSNFVLESITSTTAEFSWTASLNEVQGYTWVVMSFGDNPETDTPVASGSVGTGVTTVEVTGLTAVTSYELYVKTLCDGTNVSDAAGPIGFQTGILNLKDNVAKGFNFYPNPAMETVFVEAQYAIESISVLNSLGQLVIYLDQLDNATTKIDVSGLEKGAYFIKVDAKDNSGVYKLLKK